MVMTDKTEEDIEKNESQNHIDLEPYLNYHYSDFIPTLYRVMFQRLPDQSGLNNFLSMVHNGASNGVLVYIAAVSREFNNRAIVLNLNYYRKLYKKYRWKKNVKSIPVIGRIVKLLTISSQISFFMDDNQYFSERNNSKIQTIEDKIDALNHRIDLGYRAIENKIETLNHRIDLENSTIKNRIETLNNRIDFGCQTVESKIEKLNNRTDLGYQTIELKMKTLSSILDQNLMISTSLSEKTDALPAFIANNSIKNKSMLSGFSGGVNAVMVGDFIMGIPSDEWGLGMYLSLNGHFEKGSEVVFQSLLSSGMVVLDIGANLGIYTLYALQAGCEVYSFEPTPSTFDILKKNVKVNGFENSNKLQLINKAVSDKNGTVDFYIKQGICGQNSLFKGTDTLDSIAVETIIADDYLKGLDKVDIIKIDVEGAEYYAMLGLKNIIARSPEIKILIEFSPENMRNTNLSPKILLDLIKEYGFKYYLIEEDKGTLTAVDDITLYTCYSVNLLLTKNEINLQILK